MKKLEDQAEEDQVEAAIKAKNDAEEKVGAAEAINKVLQTQLKEVKDKMAEAQRELQDAMATKEAEIKAVDEKGYNKGVADVTADYEKQVKQRKQRKRSTSELRAPEQWFPPSVDSWTETLIETNLPVVQTYRSSMTTPTRVEEMIRQMQETMRAMQQDAVRRDELAKQQAEIMTQQAELITRLQQQSTASASHQIPPPTGPPLPEKAPVIQDIPPNTQNTIPTIQNLQEDTSLPTGSAPPPIPPQLSKVHTPNHPDSPSEVEVDQTLDQPEASGKDREAER
ncbi:stress response protein NST1-like [Camellia sinensis]|uniref:stress response protein NST1-like n=1 Tax=Camellia sinensis TaxID=4442 RepID=UPI00103632AE|nr:stress response protein NST1-like [Camellia sinensis]